MEAEQQQEEENEPIEDESKENQEEEDENFEYEDETEEEEELEDVPELHQGLNLFWTDQVKHAREYYLQNLKIVQPLPASAESNVLVPAINVEQEWNQFIQKQQQQSTSILPTFNMQVLQNLFASNRKTNVGRNVQSSQEEYTLQKEWLQSQRNDTWSYALK